MTDRQPEKALGEPDDSWDKDELPQGGAQPGTPTYVTPQGHRRLQDELRQLWQVERPKVVEVVSWAAGLGDRSENADYQYGKRRLREIDRRVRYIRKRLQSCEIVDAAAQPVRDQVFFGATVTYAQPDDSLVTVTIVGTDEADMRQARVSWLSPVARALLRGRVGDMVRLHLPGGAREIEIVGISYDGG